jgi:hypothetical protein
LAPQASDKGTVTSITPVLPVSRAVVRFVEAGNDAVCEHCQSPVKFVARIKGRQVIANVYVDGRWARVEHYHDSCYEEAGEPYGTARA